MNTRWEPIHLSDEEIERIRLADQDARRLRVMPAAPKTAADQKRLAQVEFFRLLSDTLLFLAILALGALCVIVWHLVFTSR